MTLLVPILSAWQWAERQFGACDLDDDRRTRRAVAIGAAIVSQPSASFPQQMQSPAALKAAYRLFDGDQADVTYESLLEPHWQHTHYAAAHEPLVLLIHDTTEVDFSHHPATQNLGPIGDGRGRGFLLHSVLAVVPQPRQLLGLLHHEPLLRQAVAEGETQTQRHQRARESQVWERAAEAIGAPGTDSCWVHVGDRYADIFEFMQTCRENQTHFLIRAFRNRCVAEADGSLGYLMDAARRLPAQASKVIDIPAHQQQPARTATLQLAFAPLTIQPPKQFSQGQPPLDVWVVRVWEANPPPSVEQPLEWVLLSSLPVRQASDAWQRVAWYMCRWLIEDYHQCLKTGCALEQRQLDEGTRLWRALSFLAPTAVRLLQLRELARLEPAYLATQLLPADLVALVAHLVDQSAQRMSLADFWRALAQLGGHQGRKGDGPPGWRTLGRGWEFVQARLDGIRLARRLPP